MAQAKAAFLDRPLARGLAFLVFLACIGGIVWLERGRLFPPQLAANDPMARCIAARSAQIDDLVTKGRIQAGQAELIKSRASEMCAGEPTAPPPPGEPPR
jgi:hypothetical protein